MSAVQLKWPWCGSGGWERVCANGAESTKSFLLTLLLREALPADAELYIVTLRQQTPFFRAASPVLSLVTGSQAFRPMNSFTVPRKGRVPGQPRPLFLRPQGVWGPCPEATEGPRGSGGCLSEWPQPPLVLASRAASVPAASCYRGLTEAWRTATHLLPLRLLLVDII